MSELKKKTKTVQFGGKDVTIKEMSLGDFSRIGETLSRVAGRSAIIDAFKSDDTEKQALAMADLLIMVPQDLSELIEIATDLKAPEILKETPGEVMELILEIWKLNNLVEIFGKKLGGVLGSFSGTPKKVAAPPSDPVTPPPSV